MRMRHAIILASVLALATVALVPMQAQRQGGAGAGGGRGEAPTVGPGNLITGAWGADSVPVESRGWGWMTKSYVTAGNKRPFYNKAKELLFSDKQVTSYRISTFDTEFYCKVCKHYGFV